MREKQITVRPLKLFIFLFIFSISAIAQKNNIALLDLTVRNSETTNGNKFSAENLLKIAGLPYIVTDSVELACKSKFILISSNVEDSSFTAIEKDSLIAFVQNGGTLFATNVKDTALYTLFGVSNYQFDTKRYWFNWILDSTDNSFRWINDINEKQIKLGDTSYTDVINTRSYTLSTATAIATFENDSAALTKNNFGAGHAYNLGISWKDLVLRNHVMASYKAARTYSNGFEPGSDVFAFFIRAIFAKYNPYTVWKHTSGLNSKSTFVITHDVDATTSIRDMMSNFASYEKDNNIVATYFITTHYMHDSIAKNFWDHYIDELIGLKFKGHEIASHSVSHVPDFDNESIVPEGTCGNTELTYQPFYNGHFSTNVTVCGETEVSKSLLETNLGVSIHSFRSGYLAYNSKILNSLETNNYWFNSSHSANNVLTEFPFYGHLDLSMSGSESSILEIPNTISDVFTANPISESNFDSKVAIWEDVIKRNSENNAPTILLIHPNRTWKITAEQNLLRSLTSDIRIVPFEHFGNYWKSRVATDFDYNLIADTLIVTIKNTSLPLHHDLSFIVDDGMLLGKIIVQDESGNEIKLLQAKWETQSKILYSENFSQSYTDFYFKPDQEPIVNDNYPNPFSTSTTFSFELMKEAGVTFKIFDITGRLIEKPIFQPLSLGHYTYTFYNDNLSPGLYFYSFQFDLDKPIVKKMIVK